MIHNWGYVYIYIYVYDYICVCAPLTAYQGKPKDAHPNDTLPSNEGFISPHPG